MLSTPKAAKKYTAIAATIALPFTAMPAAVQAEEITPAGIISTQEKISYLEAELTEEGLSLIETETVFVEGYGNIEVIYDFLAETITMVDERGEHEVITFEELGEIAHLALEAQAVSTEPGQSRSLKTEAICTALTTDTGAIHKDAWQTALNLAGVNPYVRAAPWLGEAGVWGYLRSNC